MFGRRRNDTGVHPLHRKAGRRSLLPGVLAGVVTGSVLGLLAAGVHGLLRDDQPATPLRQVGDVIVRDEARPPLSSMPVAGVDEDDAEDPMVACMEEYVAQSSGPEPGAGDDETERGRLVDEAQRHCIETLYAAG
jgi:hypothetical protein